MWFLATADFDIWPLAWIAVVPTLWAVERAGTRRRAMILGFVTGFVTSAGGYYWIIDLLARFAAVPWILGLLGLILLAGYQALVFMLFAAAFKKIREISAERRGHPLPAALVAPVVMVTFELVTPLIFDHYLAITQAWVIPVIQIAEITGPVGVTALLFAVGGAIYDAIVETERRRRMMPGAVVAGILAVCLVYGFVRISQIDSRRAEAPELTIGIVQGNVPQAEKGIDAAENAARQLRDMQEMSAKLEAQGADFVMWPETSYPYMIDRAQQQDFPPNHGARIRRGFENPVMFGALSKNRRTGRKEKAYNSAFMVDADGRFVGRFDKMYRMLGSEYIPGIETFSWIEDLLPAAAGHLNGGKEIVTFPLTIDGKEYRLGPMICLEDIITEFNRKLGAEHPHLLVNITNDAWFGATSEPWQHLALSVFRAVEMRTDLVRAVNTGVSAYIDANGRVYKKTYSIDPVRNPKGVDGVVGDVRLMEGGHTFFIRFGDVFGWLCLILTFGAWFVWPRLRRREAVEAVSESK
jgi:apolipoprotein N-acyltransferase